MSNGSKALETALKEPPDMVLLDLHLPGQYDGFAVCERLRADSKTAAVPVVIISARDDADSRAHAKKSAPMRTTASRLARWRSSRKSRASGALHWLPRRSVSLR